MDYGKKIGEVFRAYLEGIKPSKKKLRVSEENRVSAPDDRVEISSKAMEIKVAMEALSSVPEVRKDKVEEIKRLIEEGKYNPDPKEVAKKMVEEFYRSSGE